MIPKASAQKVLPDVGVEPHRQAKAVPSAARESEPAPRSQATYTRAQFSSLPPGWIC